MRRGARQVVMAVTMLATLCACATERGAPLTAPPPDTAAPAPSATPSPTPTPDVATPPERPDMSAVDTTTAEAVAVYFLGLYGYAYANSDLTQWRTLSHPDCVFCADTAADIDRATRAGETVEGGTLSVIESAPTEITHGTWYSVEVTAQQSPWASRGPDGLLLDSSDDPSTHVFTVVVVRETDQWLIRAVQVDERPA